MKMMKQILCSWLSLSVLAGIGLSVNALNYGEEWSSYSGTIATTYSDVPSTYWAYDAVVRTSAKKWFGGYPDGSFMPESSITRAEALKVFVTFLGLELIDVKQSSFYDVDVNEWYAPYIEAGKDLFPTHTTIQGKTPFNPNMPVTREDTVFALVKALGCNLSERYVDQSVLNMFQDQSSISGSIKSFFAIALNHKLISGYPDRTIRAQDPLTRAEFATLLLRGTEHGFHDKYEAKIQSATITPVSPIEMEIGEIVTLSARAAYTDGTSQEYADMQPYDASGNGVITLIGAQVKAQKEGTATIKYNGQHLENEATIISVKKPTSAPKLKITAYPDNTEEEFIEITGKVTDESGSEIDLTCNGKDIPIQDDGSFTAEIRLNNGENRVTLIAENAYGNQTSKSITITRTTGETVQSQSVFVTSTSYYNYLDIPMFDDFCGSEPSVEMEDEGLLNVYDYPIVDQELIRKQVKNYVNFLVKTGCKCTKNDPEWYNLTKDDILISIYYSPTGKLSIRQEMPEYYNSNN